MGTTNSEQRARLQRHDSGDPDDTVYLGIRYPPKPSSAQSRRESKTYHEYDDCAVIKRHYHEVREVTRETAQLWHKAPCKRCVIPEVAMKGGHYK